MPSEDDHENMQSVQVIVRFTSIHNWQTDLSGYQWSIQPEMIGGLNDTTICWRNLFRGVMVLVSI